MNIEITEQEKQLIEKMRMLPEKDCEFIAGTVDFLIEASNTNLSETSAGGEA